MIGQVILDTVLRPIFAIWITIAQNYQKALLYFVLLCLSGLIIGLTCLCGNWIATKCLLPIERDIYAVRRAQRAYADEHINDTRIVIDRHLRGSPTESRYSANGKIVENVDKFIKNSFRISGSNKRLSWVYVRETLV